MNIYSTEIKLYLLHINSAYGTIRHLSMTQKVDIAHSTISGSDYNSPYRLSPHGTLCNINNISCHL